VQLAHREDYRGVEPAPEPSIDDEDGSTISTMSTQKTHRYQFKDLGPSVSEYLDAVVAMLEKLSALSILRR